MKRRLAAALALGLGGCLGSALSDLGIPMGTHTASVEGLVGYAGYLDAGLVSQKFRLRFLFPDNQECRYVVGLPGHVTYVTVKYLGDVARGATYCQPVGIASLEAWRDRRPRPLTNALPAGSQARFAPIYGDGGVILARGSFPQASRIGWRPTDDVVAVLPATPECHALVQAGAAEMHFQPTGAPAFYLQGPGGGCAVLGLARPL